MRDRVRIQSVETLSQKWGTLKSTTFDYCRSDGRWESQTRESYGRGDGAVVLPYDRDRGTVLLVRQFRLPAYQHGHDEPLLEACAGLLDGDDPETCARREAEEELGYRVRDLEFAFAPFMSPGSFTERLSCFLAAYDASDRISAGGGHVDEGEDIEVVEMLLDEARAAIDDGRIIDGKTIALVLHLVLRELERR